MVCFGPLTNLAMAVKMQPQIKNWFKEIYVLGGNIQGIEQLLLKKQVLI